MLKEGFLQCYLKRYSKAFNPTTVICEDSYLKYRRHNNQQLFTVHLPGFNSATFEMDNC